MAPPSWERVQSLPAAPGATSSNPSQMVVPATGHSVGPPAPAVAPGPGEPPTGAAPPEPGAPPGLPAEPGAPPALPPEPVTPPEPVAPPEPVTPPEPDDTDPPVPGELPPVLFTPAPPEEEAIEPPLPVAPPDAIATELSGVEHAANATKSGNAAKPRVKVCRGKLAIVMNTFPLLAKTIESSVTRAGRAGFGVCRSREGMSRRSSVAAAAAAKTAQAPTAYSTHMIFFRPFPWLREPVRPRTNGAPTGTAGETDRLTSPPPRLRLADGFSEIPSGN